MHIWRRGSKISCASRRWSHFPCLYGNRFAACSLLTLISFWTLNCSSQACAFVLFLLTMDSTKVMYELKYNFFSQLNVTTGYTTLLFERGHKWQFSGNSKVSVPFGHFPSLADGLGFSKEPIMYPASMTSCTTHPRGIFAKLLKAVLVWKQAATENLWMNFHAKKSWRIYAVLG